MAAFKSPLASINYYLAYGLSTSNYATKISISPVFTTTVD